MTPLCTVTPIGIHPSFVLVRPPFFRAIAGGVIMRTDLGEEAITDDEILKLSTSFEVEAIRLRSEGKIYAAAQARCKLRDLTTACKAVGEHRA